MSKNNDINKLKIINQAIKDTEYITVFTISWNN